MRVLLVANYRPDGQESMLRFADTMERGLRERGVEVEVARPEPVAGRMRPGAGGVGKWLGYADKFALFPQGLRRAAGRVDVVHLLDHSNAMYVRHFAGCPHVVTVHDLLAVRSALGEFPENRVRWSGRCLQGMIVAGLRRARRAVCISAATRRDYERLIVPRPGAVAVTPMGMNFPYAPSPGVERPHARPYLLSVGGGQWYKNREGVMAMYRILRREMGERAPDLVVVGPPVAPEPGVVSVGPVPSERLQLFYSRAEALVFPSLAEGFGWPIVEAQACGAPVVTSAAEPMGEVGGEAAVKVGEVRDAAALARAVAGLLGEGPGERAARVAAGIRNAARYSTEGMIGAYVAHYREVLGA